jgi:hypothetical protein
MARERESVFMPSSSLLDEGLGVWPQPPEILEDVGHVIPRKHPSAAADD